LNHFPGSFADFSRKRLKAALASLQTGGKILIHGTGSSFTLVTNAKKAATKPKEAVNKAAKVCICSIVLCCKQS
jgi:hypothetical protein